MILKFPSVLVTAQFTPGFPGSPLNKIGVFRTRFVELNYYYPTLELENILAEPPSPLLPLNYRPRLINTNHTEYAFCFLHF